MTRVEWKGGQQQHAEVGSTPTASALSVVVNAQADALRNGWTSSAKPEISTGHHNQITPNI
ncbi:hypothetical protein ACOZ0V_003957 [Cronobacter malonaticus]